jgi:hypothetical protein
MSSRYRFIVEDRANMEKVELLGHSGWKAETIERCV